MNSLIVVVGCKQFAWRSEGSKQEAGVECFWRTFCRLRIGRGRENTTRVESSRCRIGFVWRRRQLPLLLLSRSQWRAPLASKSNSISSASSEPTYLSSQPPSPPTLNHQEPVSQVRTNDERRTKKVAKAREIWCIKSSATTAAKKIMSPGKIKSEERAKIQTGGQTTN